MNETQIVITRAAPDELYHHGIKGQKWGVRRYQNKDGSLTNAGRKHYDNETAKLKEEKKVLRNKARTQKKIDKVKALKSEVDDMKKADKEAKAGESREEKKARLMKSSNAKEIYQNKELFTTAELADRINRIDTEARLASKIKEEKTGMAWLNEKMDKASNSINSATNLFQKVDTAYSTVSKSAIGKEIKKQLGITDPVKKFDVDDFIKNMDKKTNQEVKDASERVNNMENLYNKANRFNNRKKRLT